jgi:hypothetical protein
MPGWVTKFRKPTRAYPALTYCLVYIYIAKREVEWCYVSRFNDKVSTVQDHSPNRTILMHHVEFVSKLLRLLRGIDITISMAVER